MRKVEQILEWATATPFLLFCILCAILLKGTFVSPTVVLSTLALMIVVLLTLFAFKHIRIVSQDERERASKMERSSVLLAEARARSNSGDKTAAFNLFLEAYRFACELRSFDLESEALCGAYLNENAASDPDVIKEINTVFNAEIARLRIKPRPSIR